MRLMNIKDCSKSKKKNKQRKTETLHRKHAHTRIPIIKMQTNNQNVYITIILIHTLMYTLIENHFLH